MTVAVQTLWQVGTKQKIVTKRLLQRVVTQRVLQHVAKRLCSDSCPRYSRITAYKVQHAVRVPQAHQQVASAHPALLQAALVWTPLSSSVLRRM